MKWPKCEVCGKRIVSTNKSVKYCSKTCEMRAYRARTKEKEQQQKLAMIDAIRGTLPATAARLDMFAKQHGEDCADAAVRVVMQALQEAKLGLVNPEQKKARKARQSEGVANP